jgi:hypothetical protein
MALFSKTWPEAPESLSRQDARIALLMRAEGYSREAVAEAIWHSASELRSDEKRNWQRYAARTTNYAFGLSGDMELAKLSRNEEKSEESTLPAKTVLVDPEQKMPRLRMR